VLAQRRHVDVEDVQPVIEIAAQFAVRHCFIRNLVGGGEHAYIDRSLDLAAQPSQFPVFKNAQQFRLSPDRHFADLIQQQRAALRQFKTSRAAFHCTGERAFFVAEDFAFHQ